MNPMETQKIYIKQITGQASICCPFCRKQTAIKVNKLMEKQHKFNVKCTCQSIFPVELEQRTLLRKQTDLPGTFEKVNTSHLNLKMENTSEALINLLFPPEQRQPCRVANLSGRGLAFIHQGEIELVPGDMIYISFKLDDPEGSFIKKQCLVRVVKDRYVGCKLLGEDDKVLEQYLKQ